MTKSYIVLKCGRVLLETLSYKEAVALLDKADTIVTLKNRIPKSKLIKFGPVSVKTRKVQNVVGFWFRVTIQPTN